MRQTGIEIVGAVPWGTHLCQFYTDQQDLIEILVPYFKAGLENNEFCLWITPEQIRADEARSALAMEVCNLDWYLRDGRIEFLDYRDWYTAGGEFDAERVLRAWEQKVEAAKRRGLDGLRLTGDTSWLEKSNWQEFNRYEAMVDNSMGRLQSMAMCTYSLATCGAAEIMDVISNHAFALVKRAGAWQVIESEKRKQIEASLRESEERYRSLVEMSPDAIFVNRGNCIAQVNGAALALLRAENAGQIVGKSPFELFHPDYHPVIRERLEVLMGGRSVPRVEKKIVRLDGTICDVEVAASPFRDQQGLAVQVILRDITARKQAQEALRQQREWLRVTLTSIGDAVLATDNAGRITFLNPVAAALTDWKEEEALGRPASEVFRYFNEKTGERGGDIVGDVLREGKAACLVSDTILVTRTGREIPIEDSAAPIKDGKGDLAGAVLVFHDVTDKRRAQQALHQEGERLKQVNRTLRAHSRSDQALFHATDEKAYLQEVCNIIVEDCGHLLVWAGFREDDPEKTVRPVAFSGFEAGYLETLKITWADTERGRGPTGISIRTGRPAVCRNMQTDPQFLPWREQAVHRGYASSVALPLLDSGTAFGVLTIYATEPDAFSTDEVALLTELANDFAYGIKALRLREAHTRSEQNLRESEERFRTLAEGIPHAVWVTAVDGTPLYLNRRFLHDHGITETAHTECPIWKDGTHPEDLARCEEAWRELVRTGDDVVLEYRLRSPASDTYRWQLAHGTAVRDERGRVLRLIGTITDIHDQKVAEAAARESQKLESIGLLAGGIAHDFNNLLVGVIGSASLAQDMLPQRSPAWEMLTRIVDSGERAANLTRQLLAYAGKGQFVREVLDLSGAVREVCPLLRSSISKKIALQLHLGSGLPAIASDPSQIQQVLMNLVLNAAEAIGSNSGTISIRTGSLTLDSAQIKDELEGWPVEPGLFVSLKVRDTGCGMDAGTKARIFDPFFTTKFQGRGLGLAAVAGIVRAHKGAIQVMTIPGAGTTFHVLFPAAVSEAASIPASLELPEVQLRRKRTVLVVDDEQIVRDVARCSLERQGYEVLVAENGPAAIDLMRSDGNRIDLVVLDLSMPGMSGEEALPYLRELKPELEVIVSSGFNEQEALRLFEGAWVSGFIQKPYTVQELARKTKSVLA